MAIENNLGNLVNLYPVKFFVEKKRSAFNLMITLYKTKKFCDLCLPREICGSNSVAYLTGAISAVRKNQPIGYKNYNLLDVPKRALFVVRLKRSLRVSSLGRFNRKRGAF
jgi:hypothetical protein